MPAQTPVHQQAIKRGRSEAEARRDIAQLECLTEMFPDVTLDVRGFLSRDTPNLATAFGDPVGLLHDLCGDASECRELANQVHQNLNAPAPTPTDEEVREETVHAGVEVVKSWVGSIVAAWEIWGSSSYKLTLTSNLEPLKDCCPADRLADWQAFKSASRETLYSSIALDEESLARSFGGFVKAVRAKLAHSNEISLVRDLLLRLEGADFVVVHLSHARGSSNASEVDVRSLGSAATGSKSPSPSQRENTVRSTRKT